MRYDLIVVGAGPSGSTISKILASKGFKVLLLEKKQLPISEQNQKVCAGVLNPNGIEALDGIPSEIIERQIQTAEWISNKGYRGNFPFQNKQKVNAITVNRKNFDNYLIELAQNNGVNILSNIKIKDIFLKESEIRVITKNHEFLAPFIVGSGGFTCPVGRTLYRDKNKKFRHKNNSVIAGQYIIKVQDNILEETFGNKIYVFLDYSLAPFGYFYLIPHSRTLCVGTGYLLKNQEKNIKITDYLERGLKHPKISGLLGKDFQILRKDISFVVYQKSFPKFKDIVGTNWALIGESANLVTPFVGSGITPGIISGKLLAESLISLFERKNKSILEFYYKELANTLKNRFNSENALSRLLTSNRRMDNFVKFISNHPEYLEKAIVDQKQLNLIEKLKIFINTIF